MFFTETHLLLTKRKGESILYLSQQREGLDMKIITSTGVFPSSIDPLESVPRLANVGFDGVDIDFDCRFAHGHLDRADQHLDWAKRVRDLVRQHNMQMVHSHAL